MAKGDEKKQAAAGGQKQTPKLEQQTIPAGSKEPGQLPAADQQAQTTGADATTIGALHEMIMVVGDQVLTLAERMAELESQLVGDVLTGRISVDTPQIEFDPAWLDGVVFTGARLKHDTGNIHEPFERKAKYDDVLSWRVTGDEVVIALSDGSKHQVKR